MLDKKSADLYDQIKDLLDETLQADSQEQAVDWIEERTAKELNEGASEAIQVLQEGLLDATGVLALLEKYRNRLRTTNIVEQLMQKVHRWEKVIRIFQKRRQLGGSSALSWLRNT